MTPAMILGLDFITSNGARRRVRNGTLLAVTQSDTLQAMYGADNYFHRRKKNTHIASRWMHPFS